MSIGENLRFYHHLCRASNICMYSYDEAFMRSLECYLYLFYLFISKQPSRERTSSPLIESIHFSCRESQSFVVYIIIGIHLALWCYNRIKYHLNYRSIRSDIEVWKYQRFVTLFNIFEIEHFTQELNLILVLKSGTSYYTTYIMIFQLWKKFWGLVYWNCIEHQLNGHIDHTFRWMYIGRLK